MRLGDVVAYRDDRWKVTKHLREYRVCELTNFGLEKVEVPDDLEDAEVPVDGGDLTVLFNPTESWPFVQAKIRSENAGPIRQVLRAGMLLRPFFDWVPGDLYRPGGAIFFDPDLKLRVGEVLVAVHRNGNRTRLGLSTSFGTVAQRKAKAAAPPRKMGPTNRFERILGADPFGDDDDE